MALARFRALISGWGDASDSSGEEVEVSVDVEASKENVEVLHRLLTDK